MTPVLQRYMTICGALFPDAKHKGIVSALGFAVGSVTVKRVPPANAGNNLPGSDLGHLPL
jgi:hypothetical protein